MHVVGRDRQGGGVLSCRKGLSSSGTRGSSKKECGRVALVTETGTQFHTTSWLISNQLYNAWSLHGATGLGLTGTNMAGV